MVEDNGYAISVPVEVNTPGGNISHLLTAFPNFHFEEVDGTDPVACMKAFDAAVAHCRARKGPALVHGHVIRPYAHSHSDDARLYRPESERDAEALRDPIQNFRSFLLHENVAPVEELDRIEKQAEDEVRHAAERALSAPMPSTETAAILRHRYSEDFDPTRPELQTEPEHHDPNEGQARTMADLINACLHDEMRRDPRIVVFGEDVADCSREEYLAQKQVKGKGGVFKFTAGLQCEYGSGRVFNAALAEAAIVGRAIGMGVRGLKPVAEIQFFDYIWPAMHQLRNELSVLRWRSNGTWAAPAVIRVPIGGYLTGGAIYIRNPAKASSRIPPAFASSSRRTRSTPTACCAPPFAATIRCSSSSTSASIARPTAARLIPAPTT